MKREGQRKTEKGREKSNSKVAKRPRELA